MRMEAGTSCAMAIKPTSKMTVASIISRMLKPFSLLWCFVRADDIPVSLALVGQLPNSLPGPAGRSGPNLHGAGRQQNHSTIAELGVARTAEVPHIHRQG